MKKITLILIATFIIALIIPTITANTTWTEEEPIYETTEFETEDENWWIYEPLDEYEIFRPPTFNWSKYWQTFKNHALWSLEAWNPSQEQWVDATSLLNIERNFIANNSCKIGLNFTTPDNGVTTDWRFTLAIDYVLRSYINRSGQHEYTLAYEAYGEYFNVTFNWSDMLQYSGLIFNHGLQDDYFWFRVRRNDIPPNFYVDIDPSYTVFSGSNVYITYTNGRRMCRQSNGMLWVAFYENSDVHIANSSNAGVHWTDDEIYGLLDSLRPTMCVDSNDVIHYVFSSNKDDIDNRNLVYTNSSNNFNTFLQIVDEDVDFTFASIAVDGNDNLHLVYEKSGQQPSGGDQIFYINSTTGGASWNDEIQFSYEVNSTDDVYYPNIAVDTNNVLHVVYTIEDYGPDFSQDVYHMWSTDGGTVWTNWTGDCVLDSADTGKDEDHACLVITESNDLMVVGYDNDNDVFYRYNGSGDSGWTNGAATEEIYTDGQWPSISIDRNGTAYNVFEDVSEDDMYVQINSSNSWGAAVEFDGGVHNNANTLSALWPNISGVRTNRPLDGFCAAYANELNGITFYASSDLSWEPAPEPANTPPSLSNPNYNTSTCVDIPPTYLSVLCNDSNGEVMNITFRTNASGSWETLNQTTSGFSNSTQYAYNTSVFDSYNTLYYWSANLTDGEDWTNQSYSFTTEAAPTVIPQYPANESEGVEQVPPTCIIWANSSCGESIDVYFSENTTGSWVVRQSNLSVTANTSVYWDYTQASQVNTKYWWRVNVSSSPNVSYVFEFQNDGFTHYTILNFSGKADTQAENEKPSFLNPSPTNGSTGVATTTNYWNVTINDYEGNGFNWTITTSPNVGYNSSNYTSNGSKRVTLSGLAGSTTYTIWANATNDSRSHTNTTICTFTTGSDNTFTTYSTLNFTGNASITQKVGPTVTTNGSQYTEEVNSTMFGYLTNNQSEDTTCWFQWNKEANDFSSPVGNASVGIQPQGTNFSYNATPLENGTLYYFRSRGNNSNGYNESSNVCYLLTKPQPATSVTITSVSGGFNVSWTHGDGHNISYLVFNTYCTPIDRSNGTNIYSDYANYYHHTGLTPGTTYYYRVWEYTNRTTPNVYKWSDGNYSANSTYGGQLPVFKNPNPANESMYVLETITTWNITIETPSGQDFNWTIQSSVGNNASKECINGSYNISLKGNLTTGVIYTVWVNASQTNNASATNATYWFRTQDYNYTVLDTLTYGGKSSVQGNNPVLSNEYPTNTTTEVAMYTYVNITVSEPQGENFNVTWYTNASGSWVVFATNSTCTDGTFSQRATWANESNTKYYWTVKVNDSEGYWANESYWFETDTYSWGDWANWWTFNYSCCCPTSLTATAYNETVINLTWSSCASADTNVLVVNESGFTDFPQTPTNGTLLYNGTNVSYNHTNLINSTTYYYTIWGWNETEDSYSIVNDTASATTQGDIQVCCPFPANLSTGNNRPPTNISVQVNGSGLTVYFYWLNMTPVTNVTQEVENWSGSTNRYNFTSLWSNGWIWGNTNYTWFVNVTDGGAWVNRTYTFRTKGSRYDVTNSDDVVFGDAVESWDNRAGSKPYDGIYDVDYSGDVTFSDAIDIWDHRT